MKQLVLDYKQYRLLEYGSDDRERGQDLERSIFTDEEQLLGNYMKRGGKKMYVGAALGVAGLAALGFGGYKLFQYIKKKRQIKKMLRMETDPVKRENLRFQLQKLNRQEVAEKYKLKIHKKRLAAAKEQKIQMLKNKLEHTSSPKEKKTIREEIEKIKGNFKKLNPGQAMAKLRAKIRAKRNR